MANTEDAQTMLRNKVITLLVMNKIVPNHSAAVNLLKKAAPARFRIEEGQCKVSQIVDVASQAFLIEGSFKIDKTERYGIPVANSFTIQRLPHPLPLN